VEGLHLVISKEYLSFFFSEEIQLLISGGHNEIDIDDLRKHTIYNKYSENDPYIKEFWSYLKSLDNEQKEKFLVFVTGTNRPPLLGFKYMNPQFCIYRISLDSAKDVRFPTSSTCMNMLKLPHYGNIEKMKETLHYAINSNAGFNLE
jgi:ubiquitin-protein ligase E3 C